MCIFSRKCGYTKTVGGNTNTKSQTNRNELGKLSVDDLIKFKGIGEAKAISIITALELGRRRAAQTALEKPKITSVLKK